MSTLGSSMFRRHCCHSHTSMTSSSDSLTRPSHSARKCKDQIWTCTHSCQPSCSYSYRGAHFTARLEHECDYTLHPNCDGNCRIETRHWARDTKSKRRKARQEFLATKALKAKLLVEAAEDVQIIAPPAERPVQLKVGIPSSSAFPSFNTLGSALSSSSAVPSFNIFGSSNNFGSTISSSSAPDFSSNKKQELIRVIPDPDPAHRHLTIVARDLIEWVKTGGLHYVFRSNGADDVNTVDVIAPFPFELLIGTLARMEEKATKATFDVYPNDSAMRSVSARDLTGSLTRRSRDVIEWIRSGAVSFWFDLMKEQTGVSQHIDEPFPFELIEPKLDELYKSAVAKAVAEAGNKRTRETEIEDHTSHPSFYGTQAGMLCGNGPKPVGDSLQPSKKPRL